MRRTKVESTTLRSAGYEAAREILELEFAAGDVYQYLEVPASVYRSLMQAESKGTYFNREIRDAYTTLRMGRRAARA
jgi:hypothetical protein